MITPRPPATATIAVEKVRSYPRCSKDRNGHTADSGHSSRSRTGDRTVEKAGHDHGTRHSGCKICRESRQKHQISFLEIPPFAMMIPESTNIGTASSGKESSPPNMARIRYLAPTVKDGSKTDGRTEAIPSEIDTGMRDHKCETKIINKTTTGINVPPHLTL